MKTRLNYVDNLRTFCIALLIIYHLAMAYNTWGEANYIFLEKVNFISAIVVMISPWFMPLMFLLAGIAASFSIKKRGYGAFIKERLTRLGIHLVAGMLFINPILSFIADKTHNGYVGNYLEHYVFFFTEYKDLTGYDGGFTVGHLWFLVVLILFSILGCLVIPIFEFLNKKRYAVIIVNSLLIMLAIALFDVAPCGKRIPTYFCVYLAGYSLFSKQNFVAEIAKLRWIFISLFMLASIMNTALFVYVGDYEMLNNICNYAAFVLGIFSLLCIGKEYMNFSNKWSRYWSGLSYTFYIVHFPIVVLCQYFIFLMGIGNNINFLLSLVVSTILTCCICCAFRWIRQNVMQMTAKNEEMVAN